MTTTDEQAPQKTPCLACGEKITEGVKICPSCQSPQITMRQCAVCGELIPKIAIRCNKCGAHKRWRRIFVGFAGFAPALSAVVAIIALIPAAMTAISNYEDRRSHTTLVVTHADGSSIYIHAWNTGGQPSSLRRYTLNFGDLPILDATLEPANAATTLIQSKKDVEIELRVPLLTTKDNATKEQILLSLAQHRVLTAKNAKLRIEVEESNGPRVPAEEFPLSAADIREVVVQRLE